MFAVTTVVKQIKIVLRTEVVLLGIITVIDVEGTL
jgi:hypothetical protein